MRLQENTVFLLQDIFNRFNVILRVPATSISKLGARNVKIYNKPTEIEKLDH